MRIAFYAPLKSPRHPAPSGDRLMAQQLMAALTAGGSDVRLASELRTFARQPSRSLLAHLKSAAHAAAADLTAAWQAEGWQPDIWFSYHPYYKSPDWIGPEVAGRFGCPLVTAEASYSARRASGPWSAWSRENLACLQAASCHFTMTTRDLRGLRAMLGQTAKLVQLPPFIDPAGFRPAPRRDRRSGPARLITVAMMRDDVKRESYRDLARALELLGPLDWRLGVVGDGEARPSVEQAFRGLPAARIDWHGRCERGQVADLLANADLFVWPGIDEGYGLAYLEAQASGLPVVAYASGGVPEVVRDADTGILVAARDVAALAAAIRDLLGDPERRSVMAARARQFVLAERSSEQARQTLAQTIAEIVGRAGN